MNNFGRRLERYSPESVFNESMFDKINGMPCSKLAILTALKMNGVDAEDVEVVVNETGYGKLTDVNQAIRKYFWVNNTHYFCKDNRKKLESYELPKKYIICVKGHYFYAENNRYFSFFVNDYDYVVQIWELGGVKND